MARGAGLECRKAQRCAVKVRLLQLPLGARSASGTAATTWPSGEAPACKAGYAGSSPAVVLCREEALAPSARGAGLESRKAAGRVARPAGRVGSNPTASVSGRPGGTLEALTPLVRGAGLEFRRAIIALQVRILQLPFRLN